ncbi:MAG: 23S rRNA (adenine(2503)-C(2))-methyltransferase RlmN [Selenomonadaceae bacterium]|nr:23S rRNA (adenine(2503)-C(2))-methyltransferase RlmN [Selenomonadaceae bacterium]
MKNVFGWSAGEIANELAEWKLPPYRGKQIAEWMYRKGILSFGDMTNLPRDLRERLAGYYGIFRATGLDRQDSSDGKTSKFLLGFADGTAVETVLMRQPYGNSICVSTQAGCNMGCAFCASTLHGMERNLTAGEILAQAIHIQEVLRKEAPGQKLDTMVIMGSGEPLMNYDNVLSFLRLCHEDYVMGMGYRNITLSTSGIVPNIYRLMEEDLPVTLSISLHAPNDALRSRLMPVNRKYPLDSLIEAGRAYGERTKRRVTYEYILIDHVNDGETQARELVSLMRGQLASVNLIPINPVVERNLYRPSKQRVDWFEQYLAEHHVAVTVRREMGADIQAACGQLRNQRMG